MSTAAPDPVDPQAAPSAPPAATPPNPNVADLQRKIELLSTDRAEQGRKNAELNDRVREMAAELERMKEEAKNKKTTKLEQSGDYPALVQQLKDDLKASQDAIQAKVNEITALKGDIEKMQSTAAKQSFEQTTIKQIQKDPQVVNAEQLMRLLEVEGKLRNKEGTPMVLNGGVEQPLSEFLPVLKQPNSGYEHFFAAGGASGMGASNTAVGSSNVPPSENPYLLGNLTAQLALETRDPEKAKLLLAEANRQLAAKR